MKKRIITMLLAMLMLLQTTACAESSENTDDASAAPTTSAEVGAAEEAAAETEPEDTLESIVAKFSDRDYDGYSFRILDRGDAFWGTVDVMAEEMTGEAINDGVLERNNLLAEKLNVVVVEQREDSPVNTMKTAVAAQSDDFDVLTDGLSPLAGTVSGGNLRDFREIGEVKMDQKWWDQHLISGMSVANKVFFLTGDLSIMDNYGTWCMMFNKTIISDYGLESPYDLVHDGSWTIDKLSEMSHTATLDINGDGKWTADDQYGFISEAYNTYGLYICFGEKITDKDENDLPVFVYSSEQAINSLIKSLEVQYSDGCNMGLYPGLSREAQFQAGGGLFYFAGMINITSFRDSETDFGIIPAPKYTEDQESYYSTYSPENMTAYSIPVTVVDTARTGDILEAMAAFSAYTLTPAYYDKTLMGKSVRDAESEPMIELILNSRNFDLGSIFNWGNTASTVRGMTDPNTVSSSLQKIEKAANKAMQKFLDNLGIEG